MKWKYERWLLIISLALFGLISLIPSIIIFNAYLLMVSLFIAYISLGSLIIEIYFSSEKQKRSKSNLKQPAGTRLRKHLMEK